MKRFNSFGAFAAHLERLALAGPEVVHFIADRAAEDIEKNAKGMLGEYQSAVGQFPAWEELAESTQAERARLGYSENDPGFSSGEAQASIGRYVEHGHAVVGSSDQNLVWFDLGTSKQPPRPVFGPAAIHATPRIMAMAAWTTFAWVSGRGWRRGRITSGG